jgi:hypothetical protein
LIFDGRELLELLLAEPVEPDPLVAAAVLDATDELLLLLEPHALTARTAPAQIDRHKLLRKTKPGPRPLWGTRPPAKRRIQHPPL